MNTFLFPKNARRMRLIYPSVAALALCFVFNQALAQSAAVATNDTDTVSSGSTNQPTYFRDIQPIFMGECSRCHNEQSRFIYDWLDYKTAYFNRWELRRRIWNSWKGTYFKESMPVGNSPEALAITEEQRSIIRKWVDDGAPRGMPLPPQGAVSKTDKMATGMRIFSSVCAACHQPTGRGRPNVFPPLAGSDFLNADKERAIKTVIFGRQGEVVVNGLKYNNNMPSFPLTDADIASVLTYVYNSFGNSGIEVTREEVRALRAQGPGPSTNTVPVPANPFE